MSRAKSTEVSSPLSLFPFIGVLLSTMGALLVVLIAVSRSARDAALRDVAAERQAARLEAKEETEVDRQKLAEIREYTDRLRDIREKTERQLRDDQMRLSHVEEQMRRLEDQMIALGAAAAELAAMGQGHLDDRRQAEREIARLQELIEESKETIEAIKQENAAKKRSYAIIPYEGPNGTQRRPLYIECRANEVVLQPEGVKLTEDDLAPPIDSGNPLAAALRAAREHLVQEAGGVMAKQSEPYPLILIRPEGVAAYYAVRQAIESWDADFGYEFVGQDWKLDFPPVNPQIARAEHQAIEQARIRRRVLAEAAPRAFRSGRGFAAGVGGHDPINIPQDVGGISGDSPGAGHPAGGALGVGMAGGGRSGERGARRSIRGAGNPQSAYAHIALDGMGNSAAGAAPSGSSGRGNGSVAAGSEKMGAVAGNPRPESVQNTPRIGAPVAQEQTTVPAHSGGGASASAMTSNSGNNGEHQGLLAASPIGADADTGGDASAGGPGGPSPVPPGAGPGDAASASGSPSEGAPSASAGQWTVSSGTAGPASATGPPAAGAGGGPAPSSTAGMPALAPSNVHAAQSPITAQDLAQSRGENWAIGSKGAASVPLRRSIRVVVREDRVAILPEGATPDVTSGGREIALDGPMSQHVDEFVTAVQQHVREWGIAGYGLYWRPVLVLQIGPDGQHRAKELAQLLKDSGIEVRASTAVVASPQVPAVH